MSVLSDERKKKQELSNRRNRIQALFYRNLDRSQKKTLLYGYDQDGAKAAITAGEIKKVPGSQNKHHGRKPGTYKHRRYMVKLSRRRNRGN